MEKVVNYCTACYSTLSHSTLVTETDNKRLKILAFLQVSK